MSLRTAEKLTNNAAQPSTNCLGRDWEATHASGRMPTFEIAQIQVSLDLQSCLSLWSSCRIHSEVLGASSRL